MKVKHGAKSRDWLENFEPLINSSSALSRGKFIRNLAIVLTLVCMASAIAACAPGEPEETELQRMLAILPPLPEHPGIGEANVSFSNPAKVKRLHGFAEDATFKDVPEDWRFEFLQVIQLAGLCPSLGVRLTAGPSRIPTQMDIGYDIMAVKRCIEGGGVTVMEGDFEPHHVAASLEDLEYDVGEYEGVTIYHFNAENYPGDETDRKFPEQGGHVATLEVEGVVITAATTERLHAALDTWAGRADNLSSNARYAALAQVLGPAVSAVLLPKNDQLEGWGYQEVSEQKRYIVFASTHATVKEAEAEGPRLVEGLEKHRRAHYLQEIGEPTITDFEEEAILMIALELKEWAPGGILGELISWWP